MYMIPKSAPYLWNLNLQLGGTLTIGFSANLGDPLGLQETLKMWGGEVIAVLAGPWELWWVGGIPPVSFMALLLVFF